MIHPYSRMSELVPVSYTHLNGTLIAYSAAAEIAKTVAVLFLLNVIAPFIKSKFTTAETAKGGMAKRERNTTCLLYTSRCV